MGLQEHYCDCNFSGDKLHGKKVQFAFLMDGIVHSGEDSKFIVSGNSEGKLWIRIDILLPLKPAQSPLAAKHRVFSLPQHLVRLIAVHPEAQENPAGPQVRL